MDTPALLHIPQIEPHLHPTTPPQPPCSCAKYYEQGARFAKWRAVLKIGNGCPSGKADAVAGCAWVGKRRRPQSRPPVWGPVEYPACLVRPCPPGSPTALPSIRLPPLAELSIHQNAYTLARYAVICQENGLVRTSGGLPPVLPSCLQVCSC